MKIVLMALALAAPGLAAAEPVSASDREKIREVIERAAARPKKCVMAEARKPEEAPAGAPDPEHRDIKHVDLEEADSPERLGEEINLKLDDCPTPEKRKAMETQPGR